MHTFIIARALDKNGVLVPDASVRVKFALTPGVLEIAAVGNGDPQDIDSVQASHPTPKSSNAVHEYTPQNNSTHPSQAMLCMSTHL